ncbi:hypothetical protein [Methylobacterium nigriterrae]|uniref:hypothetical protein n=1 Tax=Methylobacterium nigriterrae TaxID=3127512 RepID=UPI00301375F6
MATSPGQLHALAEVDHCLEEGAALLAQAEERMRAISHAGATEGHRLMSAHIILKAMRRTLQLMQDHRAALARQIAAPPVAPARSRPSRWWPLLVRHRAYQSKTL